MALAIIGALLHHNIISYEWIIVGFVVGALIGAPMAIWMPMTAVPQRTALSHAFGALAAALVGTAHLLSLRSAPCAPHSDRRWRFSAWKCCWAALTFTGSLMAFGKLQELLPTRPLTYHNQNILNLALLAAAIACGVGLTLHPQWSWLFPDPADPFAGVWRAADPADRRRGHADRHRPAQQLCRACRQA